MAGVYLHVPFCRQACHYCDFHFSTNTQTVDAMVRSIASEAQLRAPHFLGSLNAPVTTLYLGGGTPSLLPPDAMKQLGTHKIMWGSDYPHHEGTYPYSVESLQRAFHDWDEGELRKLLSENAADVYGFDLETLAPIAAQHGPTIDQVMVPLEGIPKGATSPAFFKA